MDPTATARTLPYRIEFRRADGTVDPLREVVGLRAAVAAFADALARLADGGERGMLAMVCDVGGYAAPVLARRVAPGGAARGDRPAAAPPSPDPARR